jgi:hypothetical protein
MKPIESFQAPCSLVQIGDLIIIIMIRLEMN